jgi:Cof subfamily protein (haloacid dehalogenase superfamily)
MVAVDMDGTLLNNNSEVSEKNRLAINQLIKNDIKVIFATGRVFCSAQKHAKQMNLDLPMVTYNGALIKRVFSEEVIYSSKIELEAAVKLLKFAEEKNLYTKLYIDDVLHVEKETEESIRFSAKNGVPYKVIGKLSENIKDRPYMIVFIDSPDNIKKLKQEFHEVENKEVNYTSSTNYSIEVVAPEISKGHSLQRVCEHLGIVREEVLAIGNSTNDLEMLKWAGTGVAMKNSDEELLKKHDIVSSYSNDEDGVYHILKEFGVIE